MRLTILVTLFLIGNIAESKVLDKWLLRSSEALVVGTLKRRSSFKSDEGKIFTKYYFQVEEYAGMTPSQMINPQMFMAYSLGGVWKERVSTGLLSGLKEKSSYVLLLRRSRHGWLIDGAESAWQLVRDRRNSSIFLKGLKTNSHIEWGSFLSEVNEYKDWNVELFSEKKAYDARKSSGRSIASVLPTEAGKVREYSMLWLVLVMTLVLFASRRISLRMLRNK